MHDLRSDLREGEKLLWTGRPVQGLRLQPQDLLMIPFSVVWAGFVVFWNVTVWTSDAPWFFRLFGVPFLLVGLYLLVGRFFFSAYRRARMFYAVTDQRVLFADFTFGVVTRSLPLTPETPITRRRGAGPDARDDFVFGNPEVVRTRRGGVRRRRAVNSYRFDGVADGDAVQRALDQSIAGAQAPSAAASTSP